MYLRSRKKKQSSSMAAASRFSQSPDLRQFSDGRKNSGPGKFDFSSPGFEVIQKKDDDLVKRVALRYAKFKSEIAYLDHQIGEAQVVADKLKKAGRYGAMARIKVRNLWTQREKVVLELFKPIPGFVKTAKRLNKFPVLGIIFNVALAREMKESKKSLERLRKLLEQGGYDSGSVTGLLLDATISDAEALEDSAIFSAITDTFLLFLAPLTSMGANALAKYIASNAAGQLLASGIFKSITTGTKQGIKKKIERKKQGGMPDESAILPLIKQMIEAQETKLTDQMRAEYFMIAYSDTKVSLENKKLPYLLKLIGMINERNTPLTRPVYEIIKSKNPKIAKVVLKEYTKHFGVHRFRFYRKMGEKQVSY